MTIIDEFFEYLDAHGWTQAQAARAIGCSAGLISGLKAGKYPGDKEKWEEILRTFLAREQARSTILDIPIFETTLLKQIFSACDIAYEDKDIAVIVGYADAQKRRISGVRSPASSRVYYLEANKATSKHVLSHALGEMFGPVAEGNTRVTARSAVH